MSASKNQILLIVLIIRSQIHFRVKQMFSIFEIDLTILLGYFKYKKQMSLWGFNKNVQLKKQIK